MGVCLSTEEKVWSKKLDKQMAKDFEKDNGKVKLLLLGTGESGKSTILKQMKIIHSGDKTGLSEEERLSHRKVINNNIFDSIEAIIKASQRFNYPWLPESEAAKKRTIEYVENIQEGIEQLPKELVDDITTLWRDPVVVRVLDRKADFQILDSASYFLSDIGRLGEANYIPTEADVLRARSITTGIVIVPFKVGDLEFELVDVGGQRSERKKWIHCFDNVTAVMFIMALSEYDQTLYEDETVNRMQESLSLFKQMLSSPFFSKTPFIIFFNKQDLFAEKLKTSSISIAFPDYLGSQDMAEATNFIQLKFINEVQKKEIYPFFTTATDTNLVKNVFSSVQDILMRDTLGKVGLL